MLVTMNRKTTLLLSLLCLAGTHAGPQSAHHQAGGGSSLSGLDLTGSLTYGCLSEAWFCDRDVDGLYTPVGTTNFYCLFPDPQCSLTDGNGLDCNDLGTFFCLENPVQIWCDYDQDSFYVDFGVQDDTSGWDSLYCVAQPTVPAPGRDCDDTNASLTTSC